MSDLYAMRWKCGCVTYVSSKSIQVEPCSKDHCHIFGNMYLASQNWMRTRNPIDARSLYKKLLERNQ